MENGVVTVLHFLLLGHGPVFIVEFFGDEKWSFENEYTTCYASG